MCAKYRFISFSIVITTYLNGFMTVTTVLVIILITRLTEKAFHLNGISCGIFWTNETALFLSMEMFDPKFKETRGREPGQQQRWRPNLFEQ